jgi:Glyoxalase-like domain
VLRLDHVVYAVPDLDEAAVRFREEFGLDSTEGGRHERWGTANRIVPLGDQYLELVAALDEPMAAETAFGSSVLERAAGGGGWFTMAAVADDLEGVASRLGLEVGSGSRTRPDGQTVRWRMVGLDDPRREAWMPFFLIWDISDELHPGALESGTAYAQPVSRGSRWAETPSDSARGSAATSCRSE